MHKKMVSWLCRIKPSGDRECIIGFGRWRHSGIPECFKKFFQMKLNLLDCSFLSWHLTPHWYCASCLHNTEPEYDRAWSILINHPYTWVLAMIRRQSLYRPISKWHPRQLILCSEATTKNHFYNSKLWYIVSMKILRCELGHYKSSLEGERCERHKFYTDEASRVRIRIMRVGQLGED